MADSESPTLCPTLELENNEEQVDQETTVEHADDDKTQEPEPVETVAGSPVTDPVEVLLEIEPETSQKSKSRQYQGVCKWFDFTKGYGFIAVKDPDIVQDVWVHKSNIITESGDDGTMVQEQECTFEIVSRASKAANEAAKLSAQNVIPGPAPKRERKAKAQRHKGVVLWFDEGPTKQFGFIKVDETEQQIFVHADAVKHGAKGGRACLVEGQKCDFEIVEQTGGRFRAHNVNPGPAPPVDPERNKVHTGKVARWFGEKGFGFIRPDKISEEEIMVHKSNILSTGEDLTEGQNVKYKIKKRRRRDGNSDGESRPEAVDVIPGEIPKRQVFQGIVKFFNAEQGFGFIQRKGKSDEYYVNQSQIKSNSDEPYVLEEHQQCTFTPSVGRNRKSRAVDVIPGAKVDEESKAIEEEPSFEPYLPSHDNPVSKKGSKPRSQSSKSSHSPEPASSPHSDITEEERLRKEFNWRKKQRRKRAMDLRKEEIASGIRLPSTKAPAESPPASRPSKKQKKAAAAAAAANVNAKKVRAPPKKQEIKEKEVEKPQKSQKSKQSKPKSQPVEESKVLFRKNKKQNKQKKRAQLAADNKRKRAEDNQKEKDAISDHFDQKARSQSSKNRGFLSWAYHWVLSFCKG